MSLCPMVPLLPDSVAEWLCLESVDLQYDVWKRREGKGDGASWGQHVPAALRSSGAGEEDVDQR